MSTRRTAPGRAPAPISNLDHILRTGFVHANGPAKVGSDIGAGWTDEEKNNHAHYIPEMKMLLIEGALNKKTGMYHMITVSTDPYNPTLFDDEDDDVMALQLLIPKNKSEEPPEPHKYMVRSKRVKGWVFYVFNGGVSIRGTVRRYIVARPEADVRAL